MRTDVLFNGTGGHSAVVCLSGLSLSRSLSLSLSFSLSLSLSLSLTHSLDSGCYDGSIHTCVYTYHIIIYAYRNRYICIYIHTHILYTVSGQHESLRASYIGIPFYMQYQKFKSYFSVRVFFSRHTCSPLVSCWWHTCSLLMPCSRHILSLLISCSPEIERNT